MTSDPRQTRRKPGLRLPVWSLLLLVAAGVLVLILSSVWLFRTVRGFAAATDGIGAPQFDSTTGEVVSGQELLVESIEVRANLALRLFVDDLREQPLIDDARELKLTFSNKKFSVLQVTRKMRNIAFRRSNIFGKVR